MEPKNPTTQPPFPTVQQLLEWREDPNPNAWLVADPHGTPLDAASTICFPFRGPALFLINFDETVRIELIRWRYDIKWHTEPVLQSSPDKYLDAQLEALLPHLPLDLVRSIQDRIRRSNP